MSDMLLAFDIGTTGHKAVLVDATSGTIVGSATASYPTRYTPDGGAEQTPSDWWNAVCAACHELSQRWPAEMSQVAGIGCGGMMNGVVLVNKRGEAIRDAILHADVRSAPQNRILESTLGRDAIFRATANRPDCHLTLPKMRWLADHEPEILRQAAFVVQAKDYIAGRLTGVTGLTDPSDASLTGAFDVARREWVETLWQEAGLETRLLPRVVPSTQIIGTVTADAARETGLRAGIPVVMGGGDGACATAGSGVGLGGAYNYLGGTSWIGFSADTPLYDDRLSNYCGLDEHVTIFGTAQSAGTSLEWFASELGGASHSDLDALAADVPPGARNLFFLPYLQGERAPLWDENARAVFFGLATYHAHADLYRAVLEGVGFALASILDVFQENGCAIPALRLLGGGAKSELWRGILANIYNRRLDTVADVSAATSLGAAMAAGIGVGSLPDWEAGQKWVRIALETPPNPTIAAFYKPRAAFYQSLYPALKERFEALAVLS